MNILIIQILNSIFYAAVLFLISAGLSLIYGVMRIVNLAHGTFYALGAYVSAWAVGTAFGAGATGHWTLVGQLLLLPIGAIAIALVGAVIEPTLLRPLYLRPVNDPRGRHEAAVRWHPAQRRLDHGQHGQSAHWVPVLPHLQYGRDPR